MKESALERLRLVCASVAVFSLLAHGYRYLSMSFSGDAMLLSQAGEEAYQASLGRFLQPVYWQIRGSICAPLLIGLFATAFLCAAAAIVVTLLGLSRPLHVVLACGVLAVRRTGSSARPRKGMSMSSLVCSPSPSMQIVPAGMWSV